MFDSAAGGAMGERAGTIRILGLDPGLTRTGFGVVEKAGGRVTTLACGTITTPPDAPTARRLATLAEGIADVLREWGPHEVAAERIFLKGNARTAVAAIQASGVSLMAAGQANLPVAEYTPAQVKQAVVGVGSATKEQVRYMTERLAPGVSGDAGGCRPDTPDAADALAVAVCHLNSRGHRRLEEAL